MAAALVAAAAVVLATWESLDLADESREMLAPVATVTEPEIAGAPDAATEDRSSEGVTRELAAQRRLRLTVMHGEQPAGGAEVLVLLLDDALKRLAADAAGLPPRCIAAADRHRTAPDGTLDLPLPQVETIVAARAPGAAPFCALVDADAEEHKLELIDECALTGTVTFDDGRPAPGAIVRGRKNVFLDRLYRGRTLDPRRLTGMFFASETVVQADGTYRLGGLLEGMNSVEVTLAGFARATAPEVQVPWWPEQHFILHAGAELRGRVVDRTSGAPIEGVRVEALTPSMTGSGFDQATASGLDGSFHLDGVRANISWYGVRTYKEGYGTWSARLAPLLPGEIRDLRIELEAGGALRGVVRDTRGAPVYFASFVALDEATGLLVAEVLTDESGEFECSGLPLGHPLHVEIRRRGKDSYEEMVQFDGFVLPHDDLEVILPARAAVSGVVTHEGAPVAKGWVRLELQDELNEQYHELWAEITAESGTYLFESVPAGSHALTVCAEGYAHRRIDPVQVDGDREPELHLDVAVDRGAALTGTVTDLDTGRPVTGARVAAVDLDAEGLARCVLPAETLTDGEGRYRLDNFPTGRGAGLQVDHAPYAVVVDAVRVAEGSSAGVHDVRLPSGATLTAWVEGESGLPIPDAWISLFDKPDLQLLTRENRSGVVVFERLPPGEVLVNAWTDGDEPRRVRVLFQRRVRLVAGEKYEVRFRWHDGGRFCGAVRGTDELVASRSFKIYLKPLDEAIEEYRQTYAGRNGSFLIAGVPPGEYWAGARTDDVGPRFHARRRVTVAAGQETVLDFDFGAARILGSIVGPRGEPLAGAAVVLVNVDPEAGERHTAESDAGGAFELPGLLPGGFAYMVSLDGFGREQGTVAVTESHSEAHLDLRLQPEAVIRARAVDRSGAVVLHSSIVCRPDDSSAGHEPLPSSGLEAGGFRVFPKVRPIPHHLEAAAPGCFPAERDIVVTAGGAVDVELLLRRVGRLVLRVDDANGLAIGGAPIAVIDRETGLDAAVYAQRGLIRSTTGGLFTDDAGRLTLDGLPEGIYDLEVPGTRRTATVSPGVEPQVVVLTRF